MFILRINKLKATEPKQNGSPKNLLPFCINAIFGYNYLLEQNVWQKHSAFRSFLSEKFI